MNRLTKLERLCLKSEIDRLFAKRNRTLAQFPVRLVWYLYHNESSTNGQARILISVPKRNLRHAVDRNRTKRQIREFYRLHSHSLREQLVTQGLNIDIAFLFLDKRVWDSAALNLKLTAALERLSAELATIEQNVTESK